MSRTAVFNHSHYFLAFADFGVNSSTTCLFELELSLSTHMHFTKSRKKLRRFLPGEEPVFFVLWLVEILVNFSDFEYMIRLVSCFGVSRKEHVDFVLNLN